MDTFSSTSQTEAEEARSLANTAAPPVQEAEEARRILMFLYVFLARRGQCFESVDSSLIAQRKVNA